MGDRRTIALLGPVYPYRGGIAHFLEHLGEGLQTRGHETRLFTFTRQYPDLLFPGKTQMATGPGPEQRAERVLDTLNPLTWKRTVSAVRKSGAEAVIFKYWMPFFAPSFGTVVRGLRKHGIKSVGVVDNALPHERRPGDVALGRYVLRAASGLIVMSDSVRRDLEDRIGVESTVKQVLHPIYDNFGVRMSKTEARRVLGIPEDQRVVLFFGFIRKYKGLHVLLQSMASVSGQLPGTLLLVAGECYGDSGEYRDAIAQLPGGSVRWDDDYIPDERVVAYFCAADVVAQPYVAATQSGVAQIAYHFERPMIVSDVGGLPEVVAHGEAGLVVPAGEPAELAAAIVGYFENNLEAKFAPRVAAEKARYGWEPLYEAVESFLA